MRIKPFAFGTALGMVWGGSVFLATWVSYYTGYGRQFLETMAGSIYPFYAISPGGSFVGFLGGFLDGFISGSVLAWLYNRLSGERR